MLGWLGCMWKVHMLFWNILEPQYIIIWRYQVCHILCVLLFLKFIQAFPKLFCGILVLYTYTCILFWCNPSWSEGTRYSESLLWYLDHQRNISLIIFWIYRNENGVLTNILYSPLMDFYNKGLRRPDSWTSKYSTSGKAPVFSLKFFLNSYFIFECSWFTMLC